MPVLTQVSKMTPYKKARLRKGVSQIRAYIELCISKRSIIRYEQGEIDPPKDVVLRMDSYYGCGGQLVDCWLGKVKFSSEKRKIACVGAQTIKSLKKFFHSYCNTLINSGQGGCNCGKGKNDG